MTSEFTRAFVALALVAVVAIRGRVAVAQSDPRVGCYRADRPLGTSASANGVPGAVGDYLGEKGAGLRTLSTFRLLDTGRVDRPGTVMRESWVRGSRWFVTSDTLNIVLSTLTSGWRLRLLPALVGRDTAYVGEALYLTDVVVTDGSWRPSRIAIRVVREPCAPPT